MENKNIEDIDKIKNKIRIDILTKKKTTGEDIFGKLKFKKPIQVLLDETDRDFYPN